MPGRAMYNVGRKATDRGRQGRVFRVLAGRSDLRLKIAWRAVNMAAVRAAMAVVDTATAWAVAAMDPGRSGMDPRVVDTAAEAEMAAIPLDVPAAMAADTRPGALADTAAVVVVVDTAAAAAEATPVEAMAADTRAVAAEAARPPVAVVTAAVGPEEIVDKVNGSTSKAACGRLSCFSSLSIQSVIFPSAPQFPSLRTAP